MSTPIALEVAADDKPIKINLQKLKQKRCGDCRKGRLVHKETNHKISVPLSNWESRFAV